MPGRTGVGLGNQGGGKDDVAGYNTHAFVLQVPEARRSRATSKAVSAPKARNAVVGVWATTERRRLQVTDRLDPGQANDSPRAAPRPSGERVEPVGPGQPPRQPAHQRGRHPARPEGQVQPHPPGRRRGELRQVRRQPGAGTDPERALRPRASRRPTGPTSSRRCSTGVPGLTQIGSNPVPADTLKVNLGVAAGRRPRTASASSPVTRPASRTAAGSPTTSWTSSCASSPARCCPPPRAASRSRSGTASTSTTSRSAPRSRTSRTATSGFDSDLEADRARPPAGARSRRPEQRDPRAPATAGAPGPPRPP